MDFWMNNGRQSAAYGGTGGLNNGLPAAADVDRVISLSHNPGLAVHWSAEEQAILEQGLTEYASEQSIAAYAKIALKLPNKTVRDVALRKRWIYDQKHTSENERGPKHPIVQLARMQRDYMA